MPVASKISAAVLVFAPLATQSTALGPEADFINRMASDVRDLLRKSHTLGREDLIQEIGTIKQECSTADWDGYGALPIAPDTYANAIEFVESLPSEIPNPTIGVEPDGHLTFEWHKSPRHTLSVSISPDRNIHYSMLQGPSSRYGTEPFVGITPWRVVELVREVA